MAATNGQNSNTGQKSKAAGNGSDWWKVVGQSFLSLLMPEHVNQSQTNAPKPTPSQFAPEYYDHEGQLKGLGQPAGNSSQNNHAHGNSPAPAMPQHVPYRDHGQPHMQISDLAYRGISQPEIELTNTSHKRHGSHPQYEFTVNPATNNTTVTKIQHPTTTPVTNDYGHIFDERHAGQLDIIGKALDSNGKPSGTTNAQPSKFDQAYKVLLSLEGGYSNSAHDRGGKTYKGVTHEIYDEYRIGKGEKPRDVRLMTEPERVDLYHRQYWNQVHADQLPGPVANVVFDTGVNHGQGTALMLLGRALGMSHPPVRWTPELAQHVSQIRDPKEASRKVMAVRHKYYEEIVQHDHSQKANWNGWMHRMGKLNAANGL